MHHLKIMHFSVKNIILHFPTNGHPWHHLVSDLHKKLQPNAFSITTENSVEFEVKVKVAQCIEPYKNLYRLVILIKV